MTVLVLADHDQGRLSAATPRVIAAAERLGAVDVLVAGQGVGAVAAEAATLAGVAKVLVADNAAFAESPPMRWPS
jgi:electron transfer flavoprotein alpha subunit